MKARLMIALALMSHATVASAQSAVPAALAPVAEAVRTGSAVEALRRFDALAPEVTALGPVRYLEGRIAEARGDLARAERAYAAVDGEVPAELVQDATERRATILSRTGRCAEAAALLGARPRTPAMRALAAQCAAALGAHGEALPLLRAAIHEDAADVDTFALMMMLAEAQLRSGARAAAIATLRDAIVRRPEHPEAAAAEASLTALAGEPVELDAGERFTRAERFIEVLEHDRAIAELDAMGQPRDRTQQARWLHLRGLALFRARTRYAEAAEVLARAARARNSSTVTFDAMHAARALARTGDRTGAIRAYRRLARRLGQSREGAEAEYHAASLELDGDTARGTRALRTFLVGARSLLAPELAHEAQFTLGLTDYARGAHRQAAAQFAAYAQQGEGAMVRGRGLYWRARALHAAGDHDAAQATYRAAIRAAPLHWYALLARGRLGELGADDPPLFSAAGSSDPPRAISGRLPPTVALLHALGLDQDAAELLTRAPDFVRAVDGIEGLARALLDLGGYGRAFRLAASSPALDRPAQGSDLWAWQAAYPRAFDRQVRAAARAASVPPEALWAVMRQESAYDPDAVSYADAIGLMQLIPPTAERVARGLGTRIERDQLFDPEWNTRLGAQYLSGLIREHGMPMCFAGYNAGGHRVTEWRRRWPRAELDELVERIPYEQTRNYVRRVTTHLARYRYLAAPEAGWPEVPLALP